MYDPYSVLGVDRNASEEEIKKAYKALSRRYHPDANVNNPNRVQAEEKFKEIQAAYQQIMKERTSGYGGGYGAGGSQGRAGQGQGSGYAGGSGPGGVYGGFGFGGFGQGQAGYEENLHLRAAGNYLRNGYYKEARTALDGMREQERNARWYYYSAIAHSCLGNSVAALEHARRASALEPGSKEYRLLVQQLESGGTWYERRQAAYGYPASMGSDICMKFCVANLLCNFCCLGSGCCGGHGFYYY